MRLPPKQYRFLCFDIICNLRFGVWYFPKGSLSLPAKAVNPILSVIMKPQRSNPVLLISVIAKARSACGNLGNPVPTPSLRSAAGTKQSRYFSVIRNLIVGFVCNLELEIWNFSCSTGKSVTLAPCAKSRNMLSSVL